ncbi:MAG TPA: sulfate ABC transporter ATP-binding protein [Candidatus Hydrogenedentes bacterium]|nr:sulfate ABC transporter ATP-binding protein [Candidatus Hydrogenedentota bacterium]HOS01875.1 sulfate ABC transporter ATP-binding protein [Candidatus Hydrogenedentota bacterium]
MNIEVRDITKNFHDFTALRGVSLQMASGDLTALLGPSGSGKTTLLRIIAGLETPDSGHVLFDGVETTERGLRERQVGFVFQHYALFRHMTTFENVAFGLRVRPREQRPTRKEIRDRVMKLLALVQLDKFADRYPSQLSGGQRQRVALARALAIEPNVLLLDEPFGALDAKVRKDLRRWLRRLHDEIHVTSVFVTHDQEEALELADKVVVMNEGKIEQIGASEEVYHQPATRFVYDFLGNVNLFHGRVQDGTAFIGGMAVDMPEAGHEGPAQAVAYIRPHLLDIAYHHNGESHFQARVTHINAAGPIVKVELETDVGDTVHVELSQQRYAELDLKKGAHVFVTPKDMKVFLVDYADYSI